MFHPPMLRVIPFRRDHFLWVPVILFALVLPPGARRTEANQSSNGNLSPHVSLSEAKAFLDQGNVSDAERSARAYLSDNPSSGSGHFLLGLILFRKIQASAPTNVTSGPADAPVHVLDPKFRDEQARASLAEFTEGAKYAKPSAFDLKIVALDYVLLGSYSDASKWLERSVEWDPQDSEAWYYLGRAKYTENRFDEAIQAFNKCLALDPHNVKAESNLGLSYAGQNHVAEAQAAFHQAIDWQADLPHKNPEPYIDLGDLLVQQGQAQEAVSFLLQAIQVDNRESRAHEKLGSAYLALDKLHLAQIEFEAAIALEPEIARLHYLLGTAYRKQGLRDKANVEFKRFEALKANPNRGLQLGTEMPKRPEP